MNSSEFEERVPQNGDSTMAHGPSVKKSPYVSAKRSFSEHKTLENLPETESYVEDEVPENVGSEIALARQNSFTSFLTFENATFENTSMNDDGGSWVCPNCSYNNVDAGSNSCALCGAAKVILPPKEKPPPQAYQEFEDNHVPQPKHFENPQENLADPAAGRLVPQYSSSIHMNHMNTSSSSILDRKKSPRRLVAEDDDSGLRPVEAPKRTDDRKMPAYPSNHFELRKQASDGLNPPVQHRKSNPDATEQEFTDVADFEHYDVEAAAASEGTAPSSNEHEAVPQPRETQPVQQSREAPVIGKDTGLFGSRKRRMIFAAIALVVLVGIAVGVTVPLVTKDSSSSGSQNNTAPGTLVPTPTPVPAPGPSTTPPTVNPPQDTPPVDLTFSPSSAVPATQEPTLSDETEAVTATYDGFPIEGTSSFGSAVAMSADGSTVAVGTPDDDVVQVFKKDNGIWKPFENITAAGGSAGQLLQNKFGHVLAISRNGKFLAIGAQSFVQVNDVSNSPFRSRGGRIAGAEIRPQSLSIFNDGERLAVASEKNVRLYDYVRNNWNKWAESPIIGASVSISRRYIALGIPGKIGDSARVILCDRRDQEGDEVFQNIVFSREISHELSTFPPSVSISQNGATLAFGYVVKVGSEGEQSTEPQPPEDQFQGRVRVYKRKEDNNDDEWDFLPNANDEEWYGVQGNAQQVVSLSNGGDVVAFNAKPVEVREFKDSQWKLRVNRTQDEIESSNVLSLAGDGQRFAIGVDNKVHVFKMPDDTPEMPAPTASPTLEKSKSTEPTPSEQTVNPAAFEHDGGVSTPTP